ncbi:tRNA1(Val) (adenine(37)-N6)-methyltransferase [Fundicoccus culcitae]|uniref:tRNA1(Val) (Adenine(37)-N6)-methyltransferase n=1 Tax=Fundicoccus culcitae TaxID=2969821 RepID=A0ABY5PAK2_9LACT|nr:tRNA1(Val) (adenine(37)-N6)-methyltransferase [Fundicoccus culcitae]UUX35505.1 tRNA1(Val) (adenine(37)-N6)-methyltransferase [Fundicoccus culcitae]
MPSANTVPLKANERIDELIREQLQIIQSRDYFTFSVDAVLLADFITVAKTKPQRIIDFCTGNGVIPLLLSHKTDNKIEGLEIQADLVDMAQRSLTLNQLNDQITIRQMDIKELQKPAHLYDVVSCNPPYFLVEDTKEAHHLSSHAIARHEIHLSLEDWIAKAALIMRDRGKLFFVHRPNRLDDIMQTLNKYHFSIHRMRFVHPKADKNANGVLVEAIYRGGNHGVKILPPVVVHDADNQYTAEMKAIYFGE